MKNRALAAIAVGTFVAASFAGAGTAGAATKKPKVYKSCSALNKAYPNGIAKSGAKDTPKAGYKASKGWHTNGSIYAANKKLDTDRDKIACEKVGAKLPVKPARLAIGQSTAAFPGGVTVAVKWFGGTQIHDTYVNGGGYGEVYDLTVHNGSDTAVYDPSDMRVAVTYGTSGTPGPEVFDSANGLHADGSTSAAPIPPGGTETLRYEFNVIGTQVNTVVMSVSANFGPYAFFYAAAPAPAPVVAPAPTPSPTLPPVTGTPSGGLIGSSPPTGGAASGSK